jgi:hypothetical protein
MNPLRALVPFSFALLALPSDRLPAQFAVGNLVVLRIGDGLSTLSSAAQPTFLDEYTPTGVLVRSVPLPTAVAGANFQCTNSGTATSEGYLTLSADGRYLVCAGYGANPGTTSVAGSASASVPRVIARIDMMGNVDTSTGLNNAFSANNVRSAASADGTAFWVAGANSSISYATLGNATTVLVSNTQPNCRVVSIFNGQLYTSSASGSFTCVSTVGTGLPVSTGNVVTPLPGMPNTTQSPYDYFFADPHTLYVADDRTTGLGGIQKFAESGGVWIYQYSLFPGTGLSCRGITGEVTGGVVTLYATTTELTMNQLVTVTDTGASSTFTNVTTAATNMVFRGLRKLPHTGSYTVFGAGCSGSLGVPGNVLVNAPNLGQTLSADVTNLPADATFFLFGWSNTSSVLGPLPLNLAGLGAPGCFGRVSADSVVLLLGTPTSHQATFNLAIPNNVIYTGLTFYTQGLSLDNAANALGLVPSDAARVVIGS